MRDDMHIADTSQMHIRPAVLISGGSEIVAASLAEEFAHFGLEYAIVSLGRRSILANQSGCISHTILQWPPVEPEETAGQLRRILEGLCSRYGSPLPVFATEDGGLRLLLEFLPLFDDLVETGRCRHLKMGGLDKCELFEFLRSRGLDDILAPWARADSPAKASEAKRSLGGDIVAKPSLKPYSMELGLRGAKLFVSPPEESPSAFETRISGSWSLCRNWIIQQRLERSADGEELLHCVRGPLGGLLVTRAAERVKYPLNGGTACVVETLDPSAHDVIAGRIAEETGLIGLAELPFLADKEGRLRLIEMNPRPWLQVLLPFRAGLAMGREAYRALLGAEPASSSHAAAGCTWVNAERLLMAAAGHDRSVRIRDAVGFLKNADCVAMYDFRLPGLRSRWVARMMLRLLKGSG
ncbi:MAG: hypothetical protein QUS11_01605 [Candidatus Fermentibacter sp.]|nr:hypothetical protein [Candidatus Fermentibacter sp.]